MLLTHPVRPATRCVLCRSFKNRFDIVLLLLDQHEPSWDAIVSEHVLANHQQVRVVR
jgi:DNA replicative helicase MCM subunit Mcm2 (Cdc46/Mcm family)